MMKERVVLAMSGGVDSSAAAVLLHRAGYEVIGLFMRSGETVETDSCRIDSGLLPVVGNHAHRQGCCSAEDAADARRVADHLGIPFHSLNFSDSFRRIKDYFADEYLAGRTPNPCVQCNAWLKFGKLWDFAQQVGATRIATGHYARIEPDPNSGLYRLRQGRDRNKDQSYVLFCIARNVMPHILFPCGDFEKPEIRALAGEAGLQVADKKDSYEICFVPDNDYVGFLHRHRDLPDTSGNFTDPDGTILGTHDGYERFTVGQRKGLGITFGEPRFVIRVEPETRTVVLGRREDLAVCEISASEANWLIDAPSEFRCSVRIRYRQSAVPCRVNRQGDDAFTVVPDDPVLGVAPGQAAVLYDDDIVIGGGWIQ